MGNIVNRQRELFRQTPEKEAGIGEVMYQGKTVYQLSSKELIECALYLRDAHIQLSLMLAEKNRRIDELEALQK